MAQSLQGRKETQKEQSQNESVVQLGFGGRVYITIGLIKTLIRKARTFMMQFLNISIKKVLKEKGLVPENYTFLDDMRSLRMWNLLPQEVAYDKVNRLKEGIESLRDVT